MFGEQLKQYCMRHLAIYNDHGINASINHFQTAFDLGDHTAGDGAISYIGTCLRPRHHFDKLALLVEHPLHI